MDQANNVVDGLAMYLMVIRRHMSFVIKDEWGWPWTHLGDKHSRKINGRSLRNEKIRNAENKEDNGGIWF